MGTIDFDWEMISVSTGHKGGKRRTNVVWLSSKTAKSEDTRLNTINISGDLIEEAKWNSGIRVNLYRSGNSLFKFSPSSVGLYYPKYNSGAKSGVMRIINMVLIAELKPDFNGTEFDAWVEGREIFFRAKKK